MKLNIFFFHDYPIFLNSWWHDKSKVDLNSISWIQVIIAIFETIITGVVIERLRQLTIGSRGKRLIKHKWCR